MTVYSLDVLLTIGKNAGRLQGTSWYYFFFFKFLIYFLLKVSDNLYFSQGKGEGISFFLFLKNFTLKINRGIKPRPPALGAQSLSYWTTREVCHVAVKTRHPSQHGTVG